MLTSLVDRSPFAHVLHIETIAMLAKGPVLERGRTYVRRVIDLERRDAQISARVHGTNLYEVSIWVKGDGIGYACSCRAGAEGHFCKHCVAVALVWVGRHAR